MKSISAALKTHLLGPVTTLATCWQITRLDGQQYFFTSFDQPLIINGQTYLSTSGFTPSAISTGSTGEVDNLEVLGFFANSEIVEQDVRNGLFDYASIQVFQVNWANLTQGIMRLRSGTFGECTIGSNGAFVAELRGLTQMLVQEFGLIYSPICRADLGDTKCTIPIAPGLWSPGIPIYAGEYVSPLTQSSDALTLAIFQASGQGVTGSTEPAWNTTIGATTADNGITWTSMAPFRGIGTVLEAIDQHNFRTSTLGVPAIAAAFSSQTAATISFEANVSGGTRIDISDGIVVASMNFQNDTSASEAVTLVSQAITDTAGIQLTQTVTEYGISLVNHSGQLGAIVKTGDVLGAIVIEPFAAGVWDGSTIKWLSGQNAGRPMELKAYDAASGQATLWLGAYYPIQAGDRFLYYPGCDKTRPTCNNVFANILNFRGEPDMPGMDAVLTYPDLAS